MSEYVRCPKCDGEGLIVRATLDPFTCWMCDGKGFLDWVTYLMGNKNNRIFTIDVSSEPITDKTVNEIRRELLGSGKMVTIEFTKKVKK